MKRIDRSQKLKDRKKKDQRVVKCYLQSLLIGQDKSLLIDSIKQRVWAFSERQVIASYALNIFIKERFENILLENLKNVEIPNILETTFIRQLLLGPEDANKPSPEIQSLFQRYPNLLQELPRHQGDRNIYSSGAIKFSTNVWNHLWMNLEKRMKHFTKTIDEEARKAVKYHLMNWPLKSEEEIMIQNTYSLYGLLKELKIIQCNLETFEALKNDHWKSIINYHKLQGKTDLFTGTIETDGLAVSVHFERPKKLKKDLKIDFKNYECWACDPGRTNIFFMTKKNEDGSYKSHKLSRKQYYQESGVYKARKQTERWQNQDHIKSLELSLYSSKGHQLHTLIVYINKILSHWELLWKEYKDDKWSNQRMKLYGGKKRVFDQFFNKLKKSNKPIIIGYGSSKFNPTGKNELSVPTTRAYKECQNRFKTLLVDEFRTSKIYFGDSETILKKVKKGDKDVRGLLWYCSTSDKVNKFINRDLNASINILNCLVTSSRPGKLKRPAVSEKIIMEVGKYIFR